MEEDEEFFAWLDGELDREAAERVAARVAASPTLAARAGQHRKIAAGLREAFGPVMKADAEPPAFERTKVIDFGAIVAERRPKWLAGSQWAAMAATLAVGLVAGAMIGGRGGTDSPVAIERGRLVAAAGLEQALDTWLASASVMADARIGLTFRDSSGRICRSFSKATVSGLACREGEHWRIRGLFQGSEGQTGDYRMAAGENPRLAALIDETIAGEPFDAAQEKAARDRNWQL